MKNELDFIDTLDRGFTALIVIILSPIIIASLPLLAIMYGLGWLIKKCE